MRMMTGKCHRYSEYEISPTHTDTGLVSGSR